MVWAETYRPNQLMPEGSHIHLYMAGRGVGKTRAGVNFLLDEIALGATRLAMVGTTYERDVVRTLLHGETGLMEAAYERGLRIKTSLGMGVVTVGGAQISLFSSESSERLRGANLSAVLCDEVGSWSGTETWHQIRTALRHGRRRIFVATTPRNTPLMQKIIKAADSTVHETTKDNEANLAEGYLAGLENEYAGTRWERQELFGELLTDTEGALFTSMSFKPCQGHKLANVVLGVDPAFGAGQTHDETGIFAVGIDAAGDVHLLGDYSGRFTPEQIISRVRYAVNEHTPSKVVVETNGVGDWAVRPLRAGLGCPVKPLPSSESKRARAVGLSMRGEQGRIHLCADLPQFCDQAVNWIPDTKGTGSPDRLDAAAHAWNELVRGSGGVALIGV